MQKLNESREFRGMVKTDFSVSVKFHLALISAHKFNVEKFWIV